MRRPLPRTANPTTGRYGSAHVLLSAVVCAAMFGAGPATAQTGGEAQRRLEATRQQLDERKRLEQGIRTDIGLLRTERDQINKDLIETARQIQKSEAGLTAIESRLGELGEQESVLKGSLAKRHDAIARLLAAMQRMGRNPPPVMITRREDALQMVRSAMVLATAFPELRDQATALASKLNDLARVMGDIKSEGDKLKAESARLNEARTSLALLMETKRQTLAERQTDLERVRREASEIAKSVSDLNELIVRADRAVANHTGQDIAVRPAPPVAAETAPAMPAPANPGSIEVAVATPPPDPMPPAVAQVPVVPVKPVPQPAPVAPLKPEQPGAIELAPKGGQFASLNPGRLKPAIPFAQTKGQLQLPAQGRRVLAFGEKTQYGGQSKGMVLETRLGGQVTAPADAWVVYAGEFRSFGQLLIMNASDGYHVLLAGLSQIDVQVGEFVLAGQPVGVMSGPSKGAKSKSADTSPVLYIEFRKDSRPIDPDPWWAVNRS